LYIAYNVDRNMINGTSASQ